jgi:hypothetical protein
MGTPLLAAIPSARSGRTPHPHGTTWWNKAQRAPDRSRRLTSLCPQSEPLREHPAERHANTGPSLLKVHTHALAGSLSLACEKLVTEQRSRLGETKDYTDAVACTANNRKPHQIPLVLFPLIIKAEISHGANASGDLQSARKRSKWPTSSDLLRQLQVC